MFAFRHIKNSLSVLSMLLGMAALFFYPVNIILESPIINYTASGIGAVLCSCIGLFLGRIAINYPKSAESRIMAVIGIVCSALMLLILFIIIILMVLEHFGISVIG